jgi:prepilin-type N-terminal cleavage/methylation domain-containing protein
MKTRGFTLLELIVATSIFAVVVGAAYTLFESGRNLTSRAEARAELFQTARAALKAIEEDLKGAVMPSTPYDTGFIGTDSGSKDKPLDKIDFVSVNSHAMISSLKSDAALEAGEKIDMSRVAYWVETDTNRPSHGLVRYRQTILSPVTTPTPKDEDIEEISADIAYVNFRYYDGTQWLDSWDSTQSNKLPQAVEVAVHVQSEWRGQKSLEKFTSRFYLAVAAQTPEKTQ